MRNSTIRLKKKICIRCGNECYWFSKKRCKQCATIEDSLARMEEESNDEIKKEGLSELIKIADDVFSKWLRLSNADKNGMVTCYTCDAVYRWQDSQCGHYVKRGNLFLRFDPRNCRVQGKCCNEYKDGNYPEYTKRLESEYPGITGILQEEATLVYKPTRDEIRQIINEYSRKLKAFQK
jgi:ribosomal protein L37E